MHATAVDLTMFATAVGGWLRRDAVAHNVILTVTQGRLDGDVPVTGWERWVRIDDAGVLAGVAVRTPPRGPVLSTMPEAAARAAADFFAADDPRLPYVTGPVGPAEWFARRYAQLTGTTPVPGMSQRLFELDMVIPPTVAGTARKATLGDRDLLISWSVAFAAEVAPHTAGADPAAPVDARLRHDGLLWLWEVNGVPVSVAWLSRPVAGVVRVSGVYTPPERRGHGYASGCVAAATRHALATGATLCVLYTDLANPTSNRIYQALGYRPVADAQMWRFEPDLNRWGVAQEGLGR